MLNKSYNQTMQIRKHLICNFCLSKRIIFLSTNFTTPRILPHPCCNEQWTMNNEQPYTTFLQLYKSCTPPIIGTHLYIMLYDATRYDTIWRNMTRYGAVCCNMAQYDTIWHNMAQYGAIWHNMAQYDAIWRSAAARKVLGTLKMSKFVTCLVRCAGTA